MTNCTRCGATLSARTTHFRFPGSSRPEARLPYCLNCRQVMDNPRPRSLRLLDPLGLRKVWPRNTMAYRRKFASLTGSR